MAYDEQLERRIVSAVASWPDVASKKMFGGVCHLIRGNMFCGVYKTYLILRLGEPAASDALLQPHTRPFDITGRPMKAWIMVAPKGCSTDTALTAWLAAARQFALTLPPK